MHAHTHTDFVSCFFPLFQWWPLSLFITFDLIITVGFPGGTTVQNLPANAGDTRDRGSIPGAWEILWTKSLVGYSPWSLREVDMTAQQQSSPSKNKQTNKQNLNGKGSGGPSSLCWISSITALLHLTGLKDLQPQKNSRNIWGLFYCYMSSKHWTYFNVLAKDIHV